MISLEEEIRKSSIRISELEVLVQEHAQENARLVEDRNAAIEQFSSLKSLAVQLQQFKKAGLMI
jgi:hypothetical protein